jgi:hypothetical protein
MDYMYLISLLSASISPAPGNMVDLAVRNKGKNWHTIKTKNLKMVKLFLNE